MAKTGLIEKFRQAFIEEKLLTTGLERTRLAERRHVRRGEILALVQEVGKSGDLETILLAERRFLENDRAEYANSRAMKGSLDTALTELTAAERQCKRVLNPAEYRIVDEDHSLNKNRKHGVPFDEARQFFNSHAARLLNQDKARLDHDEKKTLDARKQNMRTAAKLYETRQRQTLGLETPQKAPEQGRGL